MTRDDLEALIWRVLTSARGHGDRLVAPETVSAILDAADAYAVQVAGPNTPQATAGRRAELAAARRHRYPEVKAS